MLITGESEGELKDRHQRSDFKPNNYVPKNNRAGTYIYLSIRMGEKCMTAVGWKSLKIWSENDVRLRVC